MKLDFVPANSWSYLNLPRSYWKFRPVFQDRTLLMLTASFHCEVRKLITRWLLAVELGQASCGLEDLNFGVLLKIFSILEFDFRL